MSDELDTRAGFAISTSEQKQLDELEATIAAGFQGFADTGAAFKAIRDSGKPSKRLYRGTHDTFPDYCLDVWGLTESQANRLISASSVTAVLAETTPMGVVLPASERVARELLPFKDEPEKMIGAWQRAVEEHGSPTAAQVRAIVRPPEPSAQTTVKVEVIEDAEIIDPSSSEPSAAIEPRKPQRSTATLASFSRAFNAALADGWSLEEIGDVMDRIIRERTT